jgi:sterol desaturase/sphingolipid hydroxylase (fatty acid hydroxylase superfamily)
METLHYLQQHFPPPVVKIIQLSVWLVLLAAIFVPLERLGAVRPHRLFRKQILTDLGYYFLGGLVLPLLLVLPVAALVWALHGLVPGRVLTLAAGLPLWARLSATLVVGEIGFYWGHRWTHEIPLLWRFHAIHHSAEHLDWLVNTRSHPLDLMFTRICGFIPLYLLGLAQPMAGAAAQLPLLIVLVGPAWGFFVHANLRWRFGWFEWLIATPAFHHWHHTRDDHVDRNYAAMLPWIDRLFGTHYMPRNQWPSRYGTSTPVASNLGGQLIQPLLPRGQQAPAILPET